MESIMLVFTATIKIILVYAWMFACMFAAFALAMYVMYYIVNLISEIQESKLGWKSMLKLSTYKNTHRAVVAEHRRSKFALV